MLTVTAAKDNKDKNEPSVADTFDDTKPLPSPHNSLLDLYEKAKDEGKKVSEILQDNNIIKNKIE